MRLLVSVFAPDHVEAAFAGGADIVDVKNPAERSLGTPMPELLRAVRARVSLPWQAPRWGDTPYLPGTMALAASGAAAGEVDYLKIGGIVRPGATKRRAPSRAATQAAMLSEVTCPPWVADPRPGASASEPRGGVRRLGPERSGPSCRSLRG